MDDSEKIAHDYFVHCGFHDIVYEPDGNVPPDFLLHGSIAVEVRRLNQHFFDEAGAQGLETVGIPLWEKVKALLRSMGPPLRGESWFVHFEYTRPVEVWKALEPRLRAGLKAFAASACQGQTVVAQGRGIKLVVFCRASQVHASMFVLAGGLDMQAGGSMLSEMDQNIRYCASEKARKIAKVRHKYPTWWLALVDRIGWGLDESDRAELRALASFEHEWDKIILINPRDARCALALEWVNHPDTPPP
jgi:hypothetical protein